MAAFQVACRDPAEFGSIAADANSFTHYAERIKDYASSLSLPTEKCRNQLEISGLVAQETLQTSLRNILYKLEKASPNYIPLLAGGKEFELIAAVGTVAQLCYSYSYYPPKKVTMWDLPGLLWHFYTVMMDRRGAKAAV